MSDNIDEFLASLGTFEVPNLTASIDQYLSEHSQSPQRGPLRSHAASRTKSRAPQRKRPRPHPVDATTPNSPPGEAAAEVLSDGLPSTRGPPMDGRRPLPRRESPPPSLPPSSSSSSFASAPSSSLRWACPRCTLLNEAVQGRCAACGAPHPHPRPAAAFHGKAAVACPRCTFLNPPPRPHAGGWGCEMCGENLLSVTAAGPPVAVGSPRGRTPSVQILSPNAGRLGGGVASRQVDLAESGRAESLRSSISESSLDSNEEEEEEEDDDDEVSNGDSRHGSEQGKTDVASYRELVHFLQTLESVPYDKLPCAAVPPTMAGAELRPFQLQALHWLQHQEFTTPTPTPNSLSNRPIDRYSHLQGQRFGSPGGVGSSDALTTVSGRRDLLGGSFSPLALTETSEEVTRQAAKSVRGGIFADYMGLGKTRTMIALCEATRRPRVDRVTGSQVESVATLVVCPSALLHVWLAELHRCVVPAPSVMLYHGSNRRRRLSLFDLAQKYDYVLTSYQTLRHESSSKSASPGKLYMIRWQRIVLDEAHAIRTASAQQTRACLKLSGVCKWAVTATPVYNSLNDLFPLLKFLEVPYFGVLQWWNDEIVRHFNIDIHHPRPTTALRILFSSLLLRRTPDSVVDGQRILELPPKSIRTELVDVSREEREFYDAIHTNANRKLDIASKRQAMGGSGNGSHLATFNTAFEMMIRCRQALLHPYIVVVALQHCSKLEDKMHLISKGSDSASTDACKARESDDQTSQAIQHYIDTVLRNRIVSKDTTFFQELVEELKKHELGKRECIICLDRVNRPAILPCGHTFCAECIEHALQLNRHCPMCKRPTKRSQVAVVPLEFLSSSNNADAREHGMGPLGRFLNELENVDLADLKNWPMTLSTKTQWLLNALSRIPPDEKVVVFSTFVTYLRYLQYCLNERGIESILYGGNLNFKEKDKVLKCFSGESSKCHATGEVKGLSEAKPQSRSRIAFSGSPQVLLTTFSSCSVGLNLTCANHCFMMEPLWSPGLEEQALHRVHRIGQTRPVTITKLLARGTVEEKIEQLCQKKRSLSGYCFQSGTGEGGGAASPAAQGWDVHRLRTEDLLALFANDPKSDEEELESSSSDDIS